MKIYIVKHYWKNGENATWETHPKVDKKLFEYLKENYHNFVKDKENMIKKDKYFIYLCYKDNKDVYDRNITNVTFFISTKEIEKDFCKTSYNNLEIEIADKTKNTKMIVITGLAVVLIGIIALMFFKSDVPNQKHVQAPIKKRVHNYSLFIDNWNQQVQNITDKKKYLLNRDDNSKLIGQLNSFVKPFNTVKVSELDSYNEFIKVNHSDKNITFNDDMSRDDIKEALKKLTNKSAISDIVKEVLMMNDMNIFVQENRK